MITIYGIPACNTMKKAFDYLNQKGIKFEFHDYKKKGISSETLQSFIDHLGLDQVFNKKGSTYRLVSDEQKQSLESPIAAFEFLLEKNSAIKRPIIVQNDKLIAGFNPELLDIWLTT
jgi:Spx/MgsR family transcriptional regulator